MSAHREILAFVAALAALLGAFLHESLVGGKVLSPADVLRAQASFRGVEGAAFEPSNRQLIDPVLQFQPWLEFSRAMLRSGRLPLWNPLVGCGAPHLANGQSAVFDPFHAIAYLGTLPGAYAWMAFARLFVAGLGTFLLARRWDFGPWGRWFAGLTFPLCGFLVLWLQFPVTSAAVWMPWLLLTTDRAIEAPTCRSIAALAAIAAAVFLGGHVQTSAHVLLSSGVYVTWMRAGRRPSLAWSLGVALGLCLAAIEIVPLGAYLARSPTWGARSAGKPSVLAIERPRLLESACTALPYLFGSQRRGHPHLAKGLGVQNLNESAGGFAGLATIFWLAPLGATTGSRPSRFLVILGGFGFLAAFGIPPIPNLLRIIPVLDVADNRRLTLWVAFALVMLGGSGLDRLSSRIARWQGRFWIMLAFGLIALAGVVGQMGPMLSARAERHYAKAASETPGADPAEYQRRARRQVDRATAFLPRYLAIAAAESLVFAALAAGLRGSLLPDSTARAALLAITVGELFAFGFGLNPAIDPAEHNPDSAVIALLRREASPPARILGLGAELPPNTLMRHGLADIRNYDSVELSTGLDRLAPLLDRSPDGASPTSRRSISWAGVLRSSRLLDAMRVRAVVSATPPPIGAFARVENVGDVSVAIREIGADPLRMIDRSGEIEIARIPSNSSPVSIPQTFDPGWLAEADGKRVAVKPGRDGFLSIQVPPSTSRLVLRYEPVEAKVAATVSLVAIGLVAALASAPDGRPSRGKSRARSWMVRKGRVRIGSLDLRRPSSPASLDTEGRDADGPLHV